MTLTPPSSLAPSTVTVAGVVTVTGPMTDAEFAAHLPLPVTGPLTAAELAALEPLAVTGTLTTEGGATEATLERVADSLDDVGLTAILEREKVEE